MEEFLTILTMVLQADVYIYIILGLIAANFLSAVAIKQRQFDFQRLDDVYLRDILPKVLGYVVIRIAVAGLDEDTLTLYRNDGGTWQDAACGEYVRHPEENWMLVPICRTGDFALGKPGSRIFLPLVLKNAS